MIQRERNGRWLVKWEGNIAVDIRKTPESDKNAQVGSRPFCSTTIETDCQIVQAVGKRVVVSPALDSLVDMTSTEPERRATPSSATARAQGGYLICVPKSKRLDAVTTRWHRWQAKSQAADLPSAKPGFNVNITFWRERAGGDSDFAGLAHIPSNLSTASRDYWVRAL